MGSEKEKQKGKEVEREKEERRWVFHTFSPPACSPLL